MVHSGLSQQPGACVSSKHAASLSNRFKLHVAGARRTVLRRGVHATKALESSASQVSSLPDEDFLARWDRAKAAQMLPSSGLHGWRARLLNNATALLIVEGNPPHSEIMHDRLVHLGS